MNRRTKHVLFLLMTGPTITIFSCTTTLGASLRDAAIGGAASFVQATTAELLDRWFGPDPQEQ